MQINMSGKQLEITGAMEQYAEKKCDRLNRFFDRIQGIDILVEKPNHEFEVEIITHVERHDPFMGSSRGEDVYACIDDVVDKLTRQLSEHNSRLHDRKHGD